jgi:hypothetical protein
LISHPILPEIHPGQVIRPGYEQIGFILLLIPSLFFSVAALYSVSFPASSKSSQVRRKSTSDATVAQSPIKTTLDTSVKKRRTKKKE